MRMYPALASRGHTARSRAANLSLALFWRAMPLVAAGSGLVVLLCSVYRWIIEPDPQRLKLAACIWLGLAALALVLYFFSQRSLPRGVAGKSQATLTDCPWTTALLLTATVVMIALIVVALFMLYPPATEKTQIGTWSYMDKRWIVALYLLGVGSVYLPGIFKRLLDVLAPAVAVSSPLLKGDSLEEHGSIRACRERLLRRALVATVVGCVLAVLYVAPLVSNTIERNVLDTHELVHLGSMQRIAQGATPYVDARTQYGPGFQYVAYKLMQSTEFTLRGFRLAHMIMNLVTVALLFSIILFAFEWPIAIGAILAALFVSPILLTPFVGWGVLARWFAPFVVGALAPLIIWSKIRDSARYALFAVLGVMCGALAWLSQENATTSIMTMLLVACAA